MNILNKIKDKLKKKKDMWQLYIYYQGQLVEIKKVSETFEPTNEFYLVKIKNKKHLVGTNRPVTMLMQFSSYKATQQDKKRLHIEVVSVKGVS